MGLEYSVKDYFLSNQWKEKVCLRCQTKYFTKQDYEECGYSKCIKPINPFERIKSKVQSFDMVGLGQIFTRFFINKAYQNVEAKPINKVLTTFFIGSSIQNLEEELYTNKNFTYDKICVIQPAIRLHAQKKVGLKPGVSTTFTALGTERIGASIEDYIFDIDNWLNFLSSISFPVTKLNFFTGVDWKGGEMKGTSVNAYLGLCQVGDFVYVNELPFREDIKSISDTTLGLERICWILNQVDEYFEAFTPPKYLRELPLNQLDLLRSMSLIAGSGVKGSNNREGYILRKIAKDYSNEKSTTRVGDIINSNLDYWGNFFKLPITIQNAQEAVQKEINRATNLRLLRNLNLNQADYEVTLDLDCFIKGLVKNKNVSISRIIKVLKK
ncbi:MAG: hypothetical protein Q8R00_01120 [Candidatus Nanoarchaeia archaeon]|nr:hypothetical protein [Candidatus Nanoarchaeia archaeon]